MANGNGTRIDPRTLPNYEALNREFQSIFGADADFNKFLTDANFRNQLIASQQKQTSTQMPAGVDRQGPQNQQGQRGTRGSGAEEMRNLFSNMPTSAENFLNSPDVQNLFNTIGAGEGFQGINLDPIFGDLRQEIGSIAEQNKQFGRAAVSEQARGATQQATEGLAGTGLGRSGVAAEQFGGIAQKKQQLLADVDQQVAQQKAQQLFRGSMKEADTEFAEQLRAAKFTEAMVRDALGFEQALMQMQFQADLQAELQDSGGNWFTDLVDIGTDIVKIGTSLSLPSLTGGSGIPGPPGVH